MPRHQPAGRVGCLRRRAALLCGVALVAACVAGCGSVTRHDVLTFFFTGVPAPGEEDKAELAEQAEQARRASLAARTPAAGAARGSAVGSTAPATARLPERPRAVVVKSTRYSHGPYASNECYACHETSASGGLRGFGKKEEAAGALSGAGIVPGKLVAPMQELCTGCHAGKAPAVARAKGLVAHGPVAAGQCTVCHAPHAGPEQYQLHKKTAELCADCHAPRLFVAKSVHEGKADCGACHNPHVGKDARMLKADHGETS